MNEKRTMQGALIGGMTFVAGLLVGTGVGIIVAPQSGARTRRHLRMLAEDMKDRAGELGDDLREATHRMVERSRRLVA